MIPGTKRELMELAAKAIGLNVYGVDKHGDLCVDPVDYNPWNPYKDKGQRYELARRLKMDVDFAGGTVYAQLPNGEWSRPCFGPEDWRDYATDAEAIVAAAAAVGRNGT